MSYFDQNNVTDYHELVAAARQFEKDEHNKEVNEFTVCGIVIIITYLILYFLIKDFQIAFFASLPTLLIIGMIAVAFSSNETTKDRMLVKFYGDNNFVRIDCDVMDIVNQVSGTALCNKMLKLAKDYDEITDYIKLVSKERPLVYGDYLLCEAIERKVNRDNYEEQLREDCAKLHSL